MIFKSNSRALIVGGNGQVGTQIVRELGSELVLPSSRQARHPGWISLDLATIQKISELERVFGNVALDAIYCVGGMTNVERCETETDLAMRTNCAGPALLANFSRQRGLPFVYFSTEYVFDGNSGPYDEASQACPISVYGRSKWEGELAVLANNPEALIVRTTVVYGPDHGAKNFLYALRRSLSSGDCFSVPEDQFSTPTYNRDLAYATVGLMKRRTAGVFHVCGPERMSRLEFSRRAAAFWGFDCNKIHGVPTKLLDQKAARPLKAGLNIVKLQTLRPDLPMASLEVSLEHWQRAGDVCGLG
jgi:dTDP-4-dehydrorhamnose reductase